MLKKFISGLIVGVLIWFGTSAIAASVKQYVLTEAPYPIYVNGAEYADDNRPILNYEGSTYVPLANLGDLLGVDYKWNAELKRVEINTALNDSIPIEELGDYGVWLKKQDAESEAIKKFAENNKFEVVEEEIVGYKGFRDEEDTQLVLALGEGRSELPPRLSEGWISQRLLLRILDITVTTNSDSQITLKNTADQSKGSITLTFQEDWLSKQFGETTANGVRVKKYNSINYFNISDLEKVELID